MNRKIFAAIGVVGLGLITGGFIVVRADAPDHRECKVAQLPSALAQTLASKAAGGHVGEIDTNSGAHNNTYKSVVAITKMPYVNNLPIGALLSKKQHPDIDVAIAQFPTPIQATGQQGTGDGSMSDIGENVFLDVRSAVRWMSLLALSIFVFVVYKACGSLTIKPKSGRTDAATECPTPQINSL